MKNYQKIIAIIFILVLCVFVRHSLCQGNSSMPERSDTGGAVRLEYPFEDRNMFFGLTLINPWKHVPEVEELGVSWLSLQPHVIWFTIEKEPGVYDWSRLDSEIRAIQQLDLDMTMVLSPIINAFGEEREKIRQMARNYPSVMAFFRTGNVGDMKLYPHGKTIPMWSEFVRRAVERYDGDGTGDMPGLKYPARYWHFIEEYPTPTLKDTRAYLELLKITSKTIKSADPEAKVILAGLAGNFARYFAFADGYITDDEAGVYKGRKLTRRQMAELPMVKWQKKKYEYILKAGKDYFDIIDVHAYIIKESFMEGEIDYIWNTMRKFGYEKPIWIIEGGGPFKNYPGKDAINTPAESYFGLGSLKENAEFVIKLHAMAAAKGVERQHWGLGYSLKKGGYWDGAWKGMSLVDGEEGFKRPSYYTFKLMREKLDNFTRIKDLSRGTLRVFAFGVRGKIVYIIWNNSETIVPTDFSSLFGNKQARITHIVTDLGPGDIPIYFPDEEKSSTSIPVSRTPIFVEVIP